MKIVYLRLFAIYVFGSLFTPSNGCVYNNPINVPGNDLKCIEIDGQCISTPSTCSGKFVAYHCPGRDVCCVNIQASECDRHLIASEGNMYLDGYIPTSGSGVTIASGVDIGQRLPREYNGLDRDIFQKLEPYMATAPGRPKNKAEVCRDSKINKNRLTISVAEASRLDQFFKEIASNKNSEYKKKLNKGKCVVRSLNHYCGDLLVTKKENKCNFSGCDSFIRNALIGKTATDSTFESALIAHHDCIKTEGISYSHVAERFRKEICYINSSHSFC